MPPRCAQQVVRRDGIGYGVGLQRRLVRRERRNLREPAALRIRWICRTGRQDLDPRFDRFLSRLWALRGRLYG